MRTSGDHVGICGAYAFVRNMDELDADSRRKQFRRQLLQSCDAGRRVRELARIRLCVLDQLADVVRRELRIDHEHVRRSRSLRDRSEIAKKIVRGFHERGVDDLARAHDADRVAVGRGAGDGLERDDSARAGPVVDDDGFTERLAERRHEQARDEVKTAAGHDWCEQPDRTRWIILRRARACQERKEQRTCGCSVRHFSNRAYNVACHLPRLPWSRSSMRRRRCSAFIIQSTSSRAPAGAAW